MTNVLVNLIIPDVRPELDDEWHDFCGEAREFGNKRRRQGTEVSALVVSKAPGRLDLPEVGVRTARRMENPFLSSRRVATPAEKRTTPWYLIRINYKPNRSFATTPSAPTNKGDTPNRFRGGFDGS